MASSAVTAVGQFLTRTVQMPSWFFAIWLLCLAQAIVSGFVHYPISTVVTLAIGFTFFWLLSRATGGKARAYPEDHSRSRAEGNSQAHTEDCSDGCTAKVSFWDGLRTISMWYAIAITLLTLLSLVRFVDWLVR